MTTMTFEQVLSGARQLPPQERARLVATVVEELAAPPAEPAQSTTNNDAWERLNQFRTELAALEPRSMTLPEQLEADRRERDELLMGQRKQDDV